MPPTEDDTEVRVVPGEEHLLMYKLGKLKE